MRAAPTECRCGKRRHRLTKTGAEQNVSEWHSRPCDFCRRDRARRDRESIFIAVTHGLTFKEIAADMSLANETVRTYWVAACLERGLKEPNVALATRWVIANLETQKEKGNRHD